MTLHLSPPLSTSLLLSSPVFLSGLFRCLPLSLSLTPLLSPISVKDQRDLKLFEAASEGRTLRLRAMCDKGVDVNARNKYGQVSSYTPPCMCGVQCVVSNCVCKSSSVIKPPTPYNISIHPNTHRTYNTIVVRYTVVLYTCTFHTHTHTHTHTYTTTRKGSSVLSSSIPTLAEPRPTPGKHLVRERDGTVGVLQLFSEEVVASELERLFGGHL